MSLVLYPTHHELVPIVVERVEWKVYGRDLWCIELAKEHALHIFSSYADNKTLRFHKIYISPATVRSNWREEVNNF